MDLGSKSLTTEYHNGPRIKITGHLVDLDSHFTSKTMLIFKALSNPNPS